MKLRRVFGVLFVLCLLCCVFALSVSAKTVASGECGADGDNLTWVLDDQGVLTVSGWGEMETYYEDEAAPWHDNTIYSVVFEDGVTSVGSYAFYNCTDLTSVTFSNSLNMVGYRAFDGCTGLREVTLPNGVSKINGYAFSACTGLNTVTLPEGLKTISEGAFSGCSGLNTVSIPQSVTYLGEYAFSGCSGLTSVTLPDGLTSVYNYIFMNCTGLTAVKLPESAEWIGKSVFEGCTELSSVTIPKNCQSIRERAFFGCSKLTSAALPYNLSVIEEYAFADCTSLTAVTAINSDVLGKESASISAYAFSGCTALSSVSIPKYVTYIDSSSFEGCTELKEIIFLGNAPSHADGSFNGITATVYYPANDDTWAASVIGMLGDSLSYEAYEQSTEIGGACGRDGDHVTWSHKDDVLTVSGEGAMRNFDEDPAPWSDLVFSQVVITDGVTAIGDYAFREHTELTYVEIADTVESIGIWAFFECTGLSYVRIPDSVTSIGGGAFMNCTGLTDVTVSDNLTSLGSGAFKDCSSLRVVSIPEGVTVLESAVFYGCKNLTTVIICGEVTEIKNEAFLHCNKLSSITIPETVTEIGENAFWQCDALTSITVPQSVSVLGAGAFGMCDNLKEIIFLGSAPMYDEYVFDWLNTTVHYPLDDTWTEDIRNDMSVGGKIKWVAYAPATPVPTPTAEPTATPTVKPTATPTVKPTATPTVKPTAIPTVKPTVTPTVKPTATPTAKPTATPTAKPTPTPVPVKITTQPKTTFTQNGATAKLTVKASGEGLKYAWYVKNKSASKFTKTSVTTSTYSVKMSSTTKDRQVYCVVTDKHGKNVQTKTVYLRMAASVTTQPKTAYAKSGAKATVTVKAIGDGLTYTWYVKNSGKTKYTKSSVTKSSYAVTMSDTTKNRQVYCVVKDKHGKTVETNKVYLRMAATVTTQPKTAYAKSGAKANVTVKAAGDGLTYTWYVKNKGETKYTKSSVTKSTYAVTISSKTKDRQVYCVVTDRYGNTAKTKTVALRMTASITTQPKSVTVKKNATAKVTVKADGDGLKYTWYVKNKGATKYTKSSVTKSTYSVTMTSKTNGRLVYCKVTDKYGNTVKAKTVSLKMK